MTTETVERPEGLEDEHLEYLMDEQIKLVPCDSGYRVVIGNRWAGHLMRRLWEADGQRELDHWLVGPASIDAKCLPYPTLGSALDYLLSTVKAEAHNAR